MHATGFFRGYRLLLTIRPWRGAAYQQERFFPFIYGEKFTPRTAHELARPSRIAHAFKTCVDELSPITAQALKTCTDYVAPVAHPGPNELAHVARIFLSSRAKMCG